MTGLCPGCAHSRVVKSATGSRFLMCRLAKVDARYTKYPPQPTLRCAGFEEALPAKEDRT